MRTRITTLTAGVLLVLLFGPRSDGVVANGPDWPFRNISDRNLFGLKPPEPKIDPKELEKQKPSNLTLTGIISIGGKRALLKAKLPAKPPEPAKEESYILAEGQTDGDIKVISINEVAGIVTVLNRGVSQTLDFINNGPKLPAASSVAATAPAGSVAIPPPNLVPGAGAGSSSTFGGRQIPRPIRTTQQTDTGSAPAIGGTGAVTPAGHNPHFDYSLTPEVQTVMIEVNREVTRDAVERGEMPPPPPTVLTPEGSFGASALPLPQ